MRSEAAPQQSVVSVVDLYVMACGNGDSLLVRFGGRDKDAECVAIDCNLPDDPATPVWQAYQSLCEQEGIEHLKYFIITHTDRDHITGADRLIQWFMEERAGIDAVFYTPEFYNRIIKVSSSKGPVHPEFQSAFNRLRETINKYHDELHPGRQPRLARAITYLSHPKLRLKLSNWHFIVFYPGERDIEEWAERVKTPSGPTAAHNRLSAAMMLCHPEVGYPLALFGGDVPGDTAWKRAMSYWHELAPEKSLCDWLTATVKFGPLWIKVPHHGSRSAGHSKHLFDGNPPPNSLRHAFVSAGNGLHHPSHEVMLEYAKRNFEVWHTGQLPWWRRIEGLPTTSPVPRIAVARRSVGSEELSDEETAVCIHVRWDAASPGFPEPEVALVSLPRPSSGGAAGQG
jgi:hypothetical protein